MKWKWNEDFEKAMGGFDFESPTSYERALEWITKDSLIKLLSYCIFLLRYHQENKVTITGLELETIKCTVAQICYIREEVEGFIINFAMYDDEGSPFIIVITVPI